MEGAIGGRRLLFTTRQPPDLLALDRKAQSDWPPAQSAEGPQAFLNIIRTLLRRKRMIFAMAAAGGLFAAFIGFLTPPSYVATAQIVVDPRHLEISGGPAPAPQGAEEAVIDTHVTVLLSDAHLRRVVAALRASSSASHGSTTASRSDSVISRVSDGLSSAWAIATRPFRRANGDASTAGAEAAAAAALKRNLRVGQERRSRIVNVSFSSPDPARAAEVANAMVQIYVEDLSQRKRSDAEGIASWLSKRLPEIRQEVAQAEQALEAYRLTHGASVGGAPDEAGQQIAQMSRQLAIAKSDAAATSERLRRARELRRDAASTAALADVLGSTRLAELARNERESGDSDQPNGSSQAVAEEVDRALDRLEGESRIYLAHIRSIEERLQLLKGAVGETAAGLSGLRALERHAAAAAQIYDALLRRQQEVAEQVQFAAPDARVLALAWAPERPSSLNPLLLIPPSAIVFALFGILLAIGVDRLDRSLRGEAEAAEALGTPCAGLTPKIAPLHARRIQDLSKRQLGAAYARAIRSLLASVLRPCADSRSPKVVLVTSSASGEGKTTLAYSLAIFVARLQWRVLLLDFGRSAAPGARDIRASFETDVAGMNLADAMRQGRPLADAVKHIAEIQVDYLPPPKLDGDLLKLLTSPEAPLFLEQFSGSYDLIVIDGPSLLHGPEASLLARLADQVLFAVQWGVTTRGTARHALQRISDAFDPDDEPRVACVLTQVDLKQHARYGFEDSGDALAHNQF